MQRHLFTWLYQYTELLSYALRLLIEIPPSVLCETVNLEQLNLQQTVVRPDMRHSEVLDCRSFTGQNCVPTYTGHDVFRLHRLSIYVVDHRAE